MNHDDNDTKPKPARQPTWGLCFPILLVAPPGLVPDSERQRLERQAKHPPTETR